MLTSSLVDIRLISPDPVTSLNHLATMHISSPLSGPFGIEQYKALQTIVRTRCILIEDVHRNLYKRLVRLRQALFLHKKRKLVPGKKHFKM